MKVNERIIDGIKKGVNRHWLYTKNLLKIKPEYLLTVSVADALTNGFENICGIDLEIKLEEPTHQVSGDLLFNSVGYNQFFKEKNQKVSRKGKVDIYLKRDSSLESWIIELKGFDPSKKEIDKEIKRLCEFLMVNNGENKCCGCFLAFPTKRDKKAWIEKNLVNKSIITTFLISVSTEKVKTDESEEDGIPIYYANCITITSNSDTHQTRQQLNS